MKNNSLVLFGLIEVICVAGIPSRLEAGVVFDYIGDVSAADFHFQPVFSPSQIFTDFPSFDCSVLDDFTVTSSELRITRVSGLFRAQGGFSGFQGVQRYHLNFFSDVNLAAGGLSGDVASLNVVAGSGASVTQVVDPVGDAEYGLVILDVDIQLPSGGGYWVGISPVSASSTTGQFFLQAGPPGGSGVPGNSEAMLANPGLGFGKGALSPLASNYAYSITAIPEPSFTAAWLIGCGGLIWRRQRPRDFDSRR